MNEQRKTINLENNLILIPIILLDEQGNIIQKRKIPRDNLTKNYLEKVFKIEV